MSIQEYTKSKLPCSILNIKPTVTTDNEDAPLLVWIPGNPGLLHYYQEMIHHLHLKHPDWEILGISHAGMSRMRVQIPRYFLYKIKWIIKLK